MAINQQGQREYPLYVLRVWQWGNSVVFPLYKPVLKALGAVPGDMLIGRIHVPYLTVRLARPERAIPIDNFGPEVLPPSWPGKEDNARTPEDTPPATAPTPGADARGDYGPDD